MTVKNAYSLRVLRIRNALGLSQEAFAKRVNSTRASIGQIELGNAKPTLELIESIAKTFSINPNFFFDAAEPLVIGGKKIDSQEDFVKYESNPAERSVVKEERGDYQNRVAYLEEINRSQKDVISSLKGELKMAKEMIELIRNQIK